MKVGHLIILCVSGRDAQNVAARIIPKEKRSAAYRQGTWETSYLSTDGLFARARPTLRQRLLDLAREVDAEHWNMMSRATRPVLPRCVEYHTVEPGGSLPYPTHYDAGSLVTIDLMLSDS